MYTALGKLASTGLTWVMRSHGNVTRGTESSKANSWLRRYHEEEHPPSIDEDENDGQEHDDLLFTTEEFENEATKAALGSGSEGRVSWEQDSIGSGGEQWREEEDSPSVAPTVDPNMTEATLLAQMKPMTANRRRIQLAIRTWYELDPETHIMASKLNRARDWKPMGIFLADKASQSNQSCYIIHCLLNADDNPMDGSLRLQTESSTVHTRMVNAKTFGCNSRMGDLGLSSWETVKAFDSISRALAKISLYRMEVPKEVCEDIIDIDERGSTFIRCQLARKIWQRRIHNIATGTSYTDMDTSAFEALRGVPQGDIPSPLCWDLFEDIVLCALDAIS